MKKPLQIGVISDTHKLLRPEALEALAGSSLIIHAGDIEAPEIVPELRKIAAVVAVRGNVDARLKWANEFPEFAVAQQDGTSIYVLHRIADLDLKPEAAGFAAVIYGHSHVPRIEWIKGVLYFNPGSAGPRRFKLPISVGRILVEDGQLKPELITLG